VSDGALPGDRQVVRVSREDSLRREWPIGRSWPNGLWGMAMLIATETTLLGLLIVTYFYLRIYAPTWPPQGIAEPKLLYPLLLLGLLVATSLPMQIASSSARRGLRRRAVVALAVALAMQTTYFVLEIVLFRDDLRDFSPRDTAYGSAYFTLLGAHHAHVAVGILLSAFFLVRIATGLTPYRVIGLRGTTLYWHVINALAIAVTLTVLSPSLA
jgi:heme/copper-type cytochrome/quinol oxidase subunit 3